MDRPRKVAQVSTNKPSLTMKIIEKARLGSEPGIF
jgi:hypothetical protein